MSACDLNELMTRIRGATPQSRIAVFRTYENGTLNAVFADTIVTQEKIKARDRALIGVFDGTMNLKKVRDDLAAQVYGTGKLIAR